MRDLVDISILGRRVYYSSMTYECNVRGMSSYCICINDYISIKLYIFRLHRGRKVTRPNIRYLYNDVFSVCPLLSFEKKKNVKKVLRNYIYRLKIEHGFVLKKAYFTIFPKVLETQSKNYMSG